MSCNTNKHRVVHLWSFSQPHMATYSGHNNQLVTNMIPCHISLQILVCQLSLNVTNTNNIKGRKFRPSFRMAFILEILRPIFALASKVRYTLLVIILAYQTTLKLSNSWKPLKYGKKLVLAVYSLFLIYSCFLVH